LVVVGGTSYEVVTHWEDTYEYEGDDNDSNWW